MGRYTSLRAIKPDRLQGGLSGLESLEDQQDIAETRRKNWTRTVGESRANAAMELSRGTLPERLAEVWLKTAHIQYRAQVDLAFARPDFLLYGVATRGCVVWRIQGDYWHSKPDRVVSDSAQVGKLFDEVIDGEPVTAVIDIWEHDIYDSDAVFEQALNDGRTGNRERFR